MSSVIATMATSAAFGAALYRYSTVLFVRRRSDDLEPETALGFFYGLLGGMLMLVIGGA